jgi:hypothetical protein
LNEPTLAFVLGMAIDGGRAGEDRRVGREVQHRAPRRCDAIAPTEELREPDAARAIGQAQRRVGRAEIDADVGAHRAGLVQLRHLPIELGKVVIARTW